MPTTLADLRDRGGHFTLAPPAGQTFQVSIPGFYSFSQTLTSATVGYAEQFATYIPPDQAGAQILADASGITGRE